MYENFTVGKVKNSIILKNSNLTVIMVRKLIWKLRLWYWRRIFRRLKSLLDDIIPTSMSFLMSVSYSVKCIDIDVNVYIEGSININLESLPNKFKRYNDHRKVN